MSRNVKKSREESLEILREYLTTDMSKRAICRKYGLNPNWVYTNLIKFAVADKKDGVAMKKLPGNVSVEKTYCDDDRDALLKRIRELEIELRRTEMARDAYDEMIRLAEQYYNIPIRKKIRCQVVESLSQKARPSGCYTKTALCELLGISRNGYYKHEESETEFGILITSIVMYCRWVRSDDRLPKTGYREFLVLCRGYFGVKFKIGRDHFIDVLRANGLMLRRKQYRPRTTD